MGRVYLARDSKLGITVVIKSPHPALLSEPEFKQRFSREVRTLLKLQHPHIVRVLDVADHDGVPFAVLEYLPGGSLADKLATSNGVMPVESLERWLPHAAEALDYLHERAIVHRDIKPANLFFDEHGHVRVGDFGIVKSLKRDKTKTSALTGTGMVLGTPDYMAPELSMGEDFDARVDQYALAVTVYEALCGSTPHPGTTPGAVLMSQMSRLPAPLTERNELVSESLSECVLKALSRDANVRFASCGEFAAAVLEALPQRSRSSRVAVASRAASHSQPVERPAAGIGFDSEPDQAEVPPPPRSRKSAWSKASSWEQLVRDYWHVAIPVTASVLALAFFLFRSPRSPDPTRAPTVVASAKPQPAPIVTPPDPAPAAAPSLSPASGQLSAAEADLEKIRVENEALREANAALTNAPPAAAIPPPVPQSQTPVPASPPPVAVPISQLPNGTVAGEQKLVRIDNVDYALRWCPPLVPAGFVHDGQPSIGERSTSGD